MELLYLRNCADWQQTLALTARAVSTQREGAILRVPALIGRRYLKQRGSASRPSSGDSLAATPHNTHNAQQRQARRQPARLRGVLRVKVSCTTAKRSHGVQRARQCLSNRRRRERLNGFTSLFDSPRSTRFDMGVKPSDST
jgi:hypothetical protein